jgi:formate--tetrahydrofolate ligase
MTSHRPISEIAAAIVHPTPADYVIAQSVEPLPIQTVGKSLGLEDEELISYGPHIAKVKLSVLKRIPSTSQSKLVVITGMNPTPLGEGKSTTSVGLAQAMGAHLGQKVVLNLRQPSMGPTFGIKGGAAGGGYSQVVPMENFNLHLTGDIHAIAAAHNLCAAQLDTRIFHESTQSDEDLFNRLCPKHSVTNERSWAVNMRGRLERLGLAHHASPETLSPEERRKFVRLNIDPTRVEWRRVVDCSDRMLRTIQIGHGPAEKCPRFVRTTGYDITVASEIMTVLTLSVSHADLKERLGKMLVAYDMDGQPVFADDLGLVGAMAVLLKDALCPNLMQTLEGTPVMVHCGPFANISIGNSSVIADTIGSALVGPTGWVLTEAGFGADVGAEKFYHIKCLTSGLVPSAAVMVVTLRAIKMHGGGEPIVAGMPLPASYVENRPDLVRNGFVNVARHIQNLRRFGTPVLVCLNHFATDSVEEVELLIAMAKEAGAADAVVGKHFEQGGAGAAELGRRLMQVVEAHPRGVLQRLYELSDPLDVKLQKLVCDYYGGATVSWSEEARKDWEAIAQTEAWRHLPLCMAKTSASFSTDAKLLGAPSGFDVHIQSMHVASGSGYLLAMLGPISKMPGLPTRPALYDIDLDTETGHAIGLF